MNRVIYSLSLGDSVRALRRNHCGTADAEAVKPERLATFDNDGTLRPEQPTYFPVRLRARPYQGIKAIARDEVIESCWAVFPRGCGHTSHSRAPGGRRQWPKRNNTGVKFTACVFHVDNSTEELRLAPKGAGSHRTLNRLTRKVPEDAMMRAVVRLCAFAGLSLSAETVAACGDGSASNQGARTRAKRAEYRELFVRPGVGKSKAAACLLLKRSAPALRLRAL